MLLHQILISHILLLFHSKFNHNQLHYHYLEDFVLQLFHLR